MKKLFTICACALMVFSLSAQADQTKGSMYLGITNAMDIMDDEVSMSFTAGYAVQDGLVVMISRQQDSFNTSSVEAVLASEAVEGVAEGDDISDSQDGSVIATADDVVAAADAVDAVEAAEAFDTDYDAATLNLHVRYFRAGYYGQLNLNDFNDATGLDPEMTLSVGAMYSLDVVDGLYIDPSLTLGRTEDAAGDMSTDMSLRIGIGMKF